MIPNRASRWSSTVYLLIGLAGGYGVISGWSWPPEPKNLFVALSVILMAVLAVRSLRAGVLVDGHGLVSRSDIGTCRLRWTEVARFETRGAAMRNQVGAVTVDRRWIGLQYHPYAEDYANDLEEARRSEASELDLQTATEAAGHYAATPITEPDRRPRIGWRTAAGLLGYGTLLAVVVRLEVLPLGTAITIAVVTAGTSLFWRWNYRDK